MSIPRRYKVCGSSIDEATSNITGLFGEFVDSTTKKYYFYACKDKVIENINKGETYYVEARDCLEFITSDPADHHKMIGADMVSTPVEIEIEVVDGNVHNLDNIAHETKPCCKDFIPIVYGPITDNNRIIALYGGCNRCGTFFYHSEIIIIKNMEGKYKLDEGRSIQYIHHKSHLDLPLDKKLCYDDKDHLMHLILVSGFETGYPSQKIFSDQLQKIHFGI